MFISHLTIKAKLALAFAVMPALVLVPPGQAWQAGLDDVAEALRAVSAADARALAERCLALATGAEIESLVRATLAAAVAEPSAVPGAAQ